METGDTAFRIGNLELKNRLILAPMAGVSDLPFRLLCVEQGAALVCSEMVSAKAVIYRNRNTQELIATTPNERPVSLQLFGSEPEVLAEAAGMLRDLPFDLVDLNMGCPVPKVAGNGEGSALMKDPDLVGRIVEAVVAAAGKPVTVKMRKGFTEQQVNAVEVAKVAQEAGASAVAVHGRTREQYYSGKADWTIIRQVKEALRIPVIGNGDVTDPASAVRMLRETGCDGIMIGRAARGNPWIFSRILTYLRTGRDPGRPDAQTIREMILRQTRMMLETRPEAMAVRQMRSHIAWYTAGLANSAKLRAAVNQAEDVAQLEQLLTKITP